MPQSSEARLTQQQLEEPLLLEHNNNSLPPSEEGSADDAANQRSPDHLGDTSSISNGNNSDTDDAAPTFWGLFFYRALYFLNGLSASTWGRFGVIYYNEVAHLTPEQIGILQGITPLISFVMMPIWGALADYCFQSRKKVYLLCKGMGTLCLMLLYVLQRNTNHDVTFGIILMCISGMSFFRASGVLDAFVLDYLGPTHRGLYGTVRLWTAVSWGIGAVIMGWMTDIFGFALNFLLFGSMMFTTMAVVGFGLPARSKKEQARYDLRNNGAAAATTIQEGGTTTVQNMTRRPRPISLFRALCRIPVILWLFQVVVIGSGMALVDSFLFVYLQNDLNASTKLCGLTVGITVLFELPIFHYSQALLQKVGHDALFAVSMMAFVIRAFGYTVLTEATVYWILPLEVLHGITFACMWIASIDFSAALAPEEWSTTVQTILSASFGCFGNVVGSIIGGWVMQQYSAEIMYRGMGCIVCGTLLLHLVLWIGCGRGHSSFLQSINDEVELEENPDEEEQSGVAERQTDLGRGEIPTDDNEDER